eukprot:g478.t1
MSPLEGYLFKKGHFRKNWKRRYFVFFPDSGKLHYFLNAEDYFHGKAERGGYGILPNTKIVLVDSEKRPNSFKIYDSDNKKDLSIQASSKMEATHWVSYIKSYIAAQKEEAFDLVPQMVLRKLYVTLTLSPKKNQPIPNISAICKVGTEEKKISLHEQFLTRETLFPYMAYKFKQSNNSGSRIIGESRGSVTSHILEQTTTRLSLTSLNDGGETIDSVDYVTLAQQGRHSHYLTMHFDFESDSKTHGLFQMIPLNIVSTGIGIERSFDLGKCYVKVKLNTDAPVVTSLIHAMRLATEMFSTIKCPFSCDRRLFNPLKCFRQHSDAADEKVLDAKVFLPESSEIPEISINCICEMELFGDESARRFGFLLLTSHRLIFFDEDRSHCMSQNISLANIKLLQFCQTQKFGFPQKVIKIETRVPLKKLNFLVLSKANSKQLLKRKQQTSTKYRVV